MVIPDPLVLCLPICCGVTALCCCISGDRIPGAYFHRRHYVYPMLTPPESLVIESPKKMVLITNPNQTEVFLGIVPASKN